MEDNEYILSRLKQELEEQEKVKRKNKQMVQKSYAEWRRKTLSDIIIHPIRDYFKRLKDHPGVGVAAMMTMLCCLAALSNKSIHSISAALLLGGGVSLIFWIIVLITNLKRK